MNETQSVALYFICVCVAWFLLIDWICGMVDRICVAIVGVIASTKRENWR